MVFVIRLEGDSYAGFPDWDLGINFFIVSALRIYAMPR